MAGVRGIERGSVWLKQSECRAEDAQPSLPLAGMIYKYGPEALSFSRQNLWADKQRSTPPHPMPPGTAEGLSCWPAGPFTEPQPKVIPFHSSVGTTSLFRPPAAVE